MIILVLVGHSIQFGLGNVYYSSGAYFDNFVYRAIYSFHMPAFMAISGYFWGMKLNKSCTIQTLIDKIKKLILPIFSWATIVTLITFVTQRINIVGCIKNEIVNFVFGLWFMWALIFCSILTFGVKKVSGKICSPAIVVVIALFLITPDILNFHLYKFVFPFFVMGGGIAEGTLSIKSRPKNITMSLLILGSCFWIISLLEYSRKCYIYNSGITLLGKSDRWMQLLIDIYRWGIAYIACAVLGLILWKLSKRTDKTISTVVSIVAEIGQRSLYIYIFSTMICNKFILPELGTDMNGIFVILLESTAVMISSLILTWFTQKSKHIFKILWG